MRALLCLAGVALIAITIASPAAGHDKRLKTRVTIEFHGFADPKQLDDFSGYVRSRRRACERDREVVVFRHVPGPGDDTVLGRARSEAFQGAPRGYWYLLWYDPPPGVYYAKARRVRTDAPPGHRHVCRPAFSDAVVVGDGP
jgi:hypothetical protein